MKHRRPILPVLYLLIWIGCKGPFDTQVSPDSDLFNLEIEYDGRLIIDTLHISLAWTEVTVESFDRFTIGRLNMDLNDTAWTVVAILQNPFANSFTDTIDDDATFKYRVRVFSQNNDYRSAESQVSIRPTTHITVPTDYDSIPEALASKIVDDKDSVFVLPGHYLTSSIHFLNKAIHLISTQGAVNTILLARDSENLPVVMMSAGLLQGFTITGGKAALGGGVFATGSSVIRQCVIANNEALRDTRGGLGGGLYIDDSVRVENCLIWMNSAALSGGGIYTDASSLYSRIINCTIYDNQPSGIHVNNQGNTVIENSIVWNNTPAGNIVAFGNALVFYTDSSPEWAALDSTNMSSEPSFTNPQSGDFHLLPRSVCVDAGNPDQNYNDPDDSLNDMGCFGGPGGDWLPFGPVELPLGVDP
ncbi:MAG: right-handed parallel beta-helix repeat-containing protein [Fidelibacterota bacterium]|nr:MAG: right-handed parallel beta-helix repeat-containing protein [Candidatus Neomarinimicrobiota bacterium]